MLCELMVQGEGGVFQKSVVGFDLIKDNIFFTYAHRNVFNVYKGTNINQVKCHVRSRNVEFDNNRS